MPLSMFKSEEWKYALGISWKILSASIKVGNSVEDLWKVFRKGIWWVAEYVIVLISATYRAEYWAVARDGRGEVFRGRVVIFWRLYLRGSRLKYNCAHFTTIFHFIVISCCIQHVCDQFFCTLLTNSSTLFKEPIGMSKLGSCTSNVRLHFMKRFDHYQTTEVWSYRVGNCWVHCDWVVVRSRWDDPKTAICNKKESGISSSCSKKLSTPGFGELPNTVDLITCAGIGCCMRREDCKITYLRKYTITQRQSCTNTQIQNEKIPKKCWHCVYSVCADGCWITGLPQAHKDLTKTATSTINIRKYTPLCEYTMTKVCYIPKKIETGNKKKKAFGVCKIISPLALILYKAPWVKSLHCCKFLSWWNMGYDKRMLDEAMYCLLTNFAHDIGFLCRRCS